MATLLKIRKKWNCQVGNTTSRKGGSDRQWSESVLPVLATLPPPPLASSSSSSLSDEWRRHLDELIDLFRFKRVFTARLQEVKAKKKKERWRRSPIILRAREWVISAWFFLLFLETFLSWKMAQQLTGFQLVEMDPRLTRVTFDVIYLPKFQNATLSNRAIFADH